MKSAHKFLLLTALALLALVAFTGTSFAAQAAVDATDSQSLLDMLRPVYDAIAGGQYAYAAAIGVVVAVALAKRYLGDRWPWLHTDAGGSLMALLVASGTALATGLAAPGTPLTFDAIKSALAIGIAAAGGYAVAKNLLVDPWLKPLQKVAPSWMQPALGAVLWIFDRPAAAVQEQAAVDAGKVAVDTHPAAGVAGIVGAQPTEIK